MISTVTATIPVGTAPVAVAVNPAGTTAYVANEDDGTLTAIDTGTNATTTIGGLDNASGVVAVNVPQPGPAVTGLSPAQGPEAGGNAVTITGSGFTGATAVHFGATATASFTVNSDTQITATAPAHTDGTVDVTVTTPAGTSAAGTGDQYTYLEPAPAVAGLVPPAGPVTGGHPVKITGTDLSGATAVSFGGIAAASFTVDSDTQITAITPAHAGGTVDVTVTTPAGTSPASTADQYTFVPTPKHTVLYTANGGDGTLKIYDPATGTITASIAAGPGPFEVQLNPAATQAWVSDAGGSTVTTITTGPAPAAVAFTPDGATAYVSNTGNGTLSGNGSIAVVDTATATVTGVIAVGGDPRDSAVTPDGSTLYVADHTQDVVYAISTATNTITKVIGLTGAFPAGLAISPDGSAVYMANNGTANISVISTATNTIIATIPVGDHPSAVAFTPHRDGCLRRQQRRQHRLSDQHRHRHRHRDHPGRRRAAQRRRRPGRHHRLRNQRQRQHRLSDQHRHQHRHRAGHRIRRPPRHHRRPPLTRTPQHRLAARAGAAHPQAASAQASA